MIKRVLLEYNPGGLRRVLHARSCTQYKTFEHSSRLMIRYDRGHLLSARATAPCKLYPRPPPAPAHRTPAPPAPAAVPRGHTRSKASIFVQVRGKLQAGVMTAR